MTDTPSTEPTTCPHRPQAAVHGGGENLDHWKPGRERWPDKFPGLWKPRSCSFCGSVHPEDALRLMAEGWEDQITDTRNKGYLHPPGYAAGQARIRAAREAGEDLTASRTDAPTAPSPPAKFSVPHFDKSQIAELNAFHRSKGKR